MISISDPTQVRNWVVLDIETSGLDPNEDVILEVAAIVYNPVLDCVIDEQVWLIDELDQFDARADAFVHSMHERSGLLADLRARRDDPTHKVRVSGPDGVFQAKWLQESIQLDVALTTLLDAQGGILVGNSVHFDRSFLRVHAPTFVNALWHRQIDVSSLKLFLQACGAVDHPERGDVAHRAYDDARHSLSSLLRYRSVVRRCLMDAIAIATDA